MQSTARRKLSIKINARAILKQGVHHSKIYNTPFIALFDMRTLVLLVFADREGYVGGDYAYVTVIDDSKNMRKALLGLLSLAISHESMDEVDWKSKMVLEEHRGWFKSLVKSRGTKMR